ncbi:hypothetical protein COT97_03770 [Candidatus Falkowbacteria bacterium CG10_big_fil_rev_8_21_14_0_10_39_11]|uniref:TRAM domain-containing protein n=1 Tax=Candidatus Falkowbacteria bacterium CG10_big_fil_rev_8_21_14_0_10_39_11 TaxID=1974565 RepID=A0A2H0V4J2_9BACT|nr:MAG: hypothetical protein COT97_03770 [Candidatus Falkowbacteria bacterium CG10_big_fil_rev_8_21_14_0_10_39_11]
MVFGGQGLGRLDNKVYFVWNALPGELVEVEVTKEKKSFGEGIARNILESSPDRIEPKEDHYLSCSPWQIMTPEAEDAAKIQVTKDIYLRNAKLELPQNLEITSDQSAFYHYRHKMEFAFIEKNGFLSLSIMNRDSHNKAAVSDCCLAASIINKRAGEVLAFLNAKKMAADDLQYISLRADTSGSCLADLYLTRDISREALTEMVESMTWLRIIQSDNSVAHDTAYENYQLTEEINGITFHFTPDVFFQINVPMFKKCFERLASFIPDRSEVIDCYAGVGSISLPHATRVKSVVLIEDQVESCRYASQNIELNNFDNVDVINGSAEKLSQINLKDKVLILDPPRAGLSPSVIDSILAGEPKIILYLSCDPATQARDVAILLEKYELKHIELFNFFPRTPHVESLVILSLKQ